ncbi:uncharacterized protein K489DRAFT_40962 [Dissoconium aciculare CBS 342.82]|uniref:Uncharacterized protein n=1 Tax=Dissoconium aciculare CBS 342.82 TaxID=1314786 RepID=A0A6J3M1C8_9PEZI|nr:uncharacterized protein K489DRAFT_40962 [Dissoconium aciculare CBS 342.82]KAF1820722.1 hypothetical protein K489DRAFT_40962 [Dissoconium aciculare CBS 342.82]
MFSHELSPSFSLHPSAIPECASCSLAISSRATHSWTASLSITRDGQRCRSHAFRLLPHTLSIQYPYHEHASETTLWSGKPFVCTKSRTFLPSRKIQPEYLTDPQWIESRLFLTDFSELWLTTVTESALLALCGDDLSRNLVAKKIFWQAGMRR